MSPARATGTQGVGIRRASADDAQAIGAVFDSAVRDGWTFLGDQAKHPMFLPTHWDGLVAEHAPPNALLVAVDGAQNLVGFVAVHTDEGELYLLFVHPAHGGRGIGRALLDAAHNVLRDAGRSEVFLYTEERNVRAQALYASAGYLQDGTARESEFNGAALRELRLVRTL